MWCCVVCKRSEFWRNLLPMSSVFHPENEDSVYFWNVGTKSHCHIPEDCSLDDNFWSATKKCSASYGTETFITIFAYTIHITWFHTNVVSNWNYSWSCWKCWHIHLVLLPFPKEDLKHTGDASNKYRYIRVHDH